ncbi:hypothetical protein U0070_020929, partial [Myodes glareolus]
NEITIVRFGFLNPETKISLFLSGLVISKALGTVSTEKQQVVDDIGGLGVAGLGGIWGGFGSGFRSQGCGQGSGCGQGLGACGGKAKDKEWIPGAKLGCPVKDMKIKSLEEIYLFSLPIMNS